MPIKKTFKPTPGRKYGNKKVEFLGKTFDSKKEAKRYGELALLERAGVIKKLETQKSFELVPKQVTQTVTERAVKYVADFVYLTEYGDRVVEDTKGFKTADYIIKRKLMLFIHGIEVREI